MHAFKYVIIAAMNLLTLKQVLAQEKPIVRWYLAGSLPDENGKPNPGVAGAFAGWLDQTMLIAGGANFRGKMPWEGGKKIYQNKIYLFEQKENKWECIDTDKMHSPKAYGASITTKEGLICIGGENENGISDEVFMLKKDRLSQNIAAQKLQALPFPLTNHAAVLLNNCIYVAGGETTIGVSDKFYVLKLNAAQEGWKLAGTLPYPVSHAVMLIHKGSIYLIGGRKKQADGISELYSSVLRYTIDDKKWYPVASLPYALSAGTGISYKENIFLFGGDKGETFHRTELLISSIAKETDLSKRNSLNMEKVRLQSTHPGFSNNVFMYNASKNKWEPAGIIPFATPVTASILQKKNSVLIISGEIKAGVRTPGILAGKINNYHR